MIIVVPADFVGRGFVLSKRGDYLSSRRRVPSATQKINMGPGDSLPSRSEAAHNFVSL